LLYRIIMAWRSPTDKDLPETYSSNERDNDEYIDRLEDQLRKL